MEAVTGVCAGCAGTRRIPAADWYVRGANPPREPEYDRDPIVRVVRCPDCYVPGRLTTIECARPGQPYRLLPEPGPGYVVHLAGESANGGTGPCLCGYDRHGRGFSVGGGVLPHDPDEYARSHTVCAPCADLASGRPISGTHAALFKEASTTHA